VREGYVKVIGLDLARLNLEDVERFAESLERFLYEELERRGLVKLDIQIGIDVRIQEVLLVTVDLTINSPVPIGPEVLAQFDEAVDKALARFEEYLSSSYSSRGCEPGTS